MQRTEERDGLALKGEYTYSDGFFKRTGTLKKAKITVFENQTEKSHFTTITNFSSEASYVYFLQNI